MNPRQRYHATAEFNHPDRAFLLPPWAWDETWARWRREGLPPDADPPAYFETDLELDAPVSMQGKYGPHLHPGLERQVLAETGETTVVRDEEGNTVKLFRDDPTRSMPAWIAYPMQGRAEWESIIRPRLSAAIPGRRPEGAAWQSYAQSEIGRAHV